VETKDVGDRQLDALLERLDRISEQLERLNRTSEHSVPGTRHPDTG
jgi:hypothetical protein